MKPFQFQCCKDENGKNVTMEELTPVVVCHTLTEAMNHPTILDWCKNKGYRIYKVVGK